MGAPKQFKLMFIFDTLAEANTAADLCNNGLAPELAAVNADKWAIPQKRYTDNKWYFAKPLGSELSCGKCSKVPKCVYPLQRVQPDWTVGGN
jgi:hypothetical protein